MSKYKTILNGGSIAGLLSYILFLVSYYILTVNPIGPIKFVGLIAVVYIMYRSLKMFIEAELEGFGTFTQVFVGGLVFSFVYASLHGMLVYMHGLLLDAGFVDFIISDSLEQVGTLKDQMVGMLGKDAYRDLIEEYQNITLTEVAIGDAQSKSLTSMLAALIFALILRKKRPIFDNVES